MELSSSYNLGLVALSFVIASLAGFTALDLAAKMKTTEGSGRYVWLGVGAVAMGVGIWSMHFIGMLAFNLPIGVSYDPALTGLSMLAAIIAAGIAFFTISGENLGVTRLLLAGLVMGSGVAAMHYGGMAAMRMAATTSYDPLLFGVSILIAVGASVAAMFIAYQLGSQWALSKSGPFLFGMRFVAALIMGVAVCGMHYTGMAAARFAPTGQTVTAGSMDTWLLGLGVAGTTFVVLFIALISTAVSRTFFAQTETFSAGD